MRIWCVATQVELSSAKEHRVAALLQHAYLILNLFNLNNNTSTHINKNPIPKKSTKATSTFNARRSTRVQDAKACPPTIETSLTSTSIPQLPRSQL